MRATNTITMLDTNQPELLNKYSVTRHMNSATVIVALGEMTRREALLKYAIDLKQIIHYQKTWYTSTVELHENGVTLRRDLLNVGYISQVKL